MANNETNPKSLKWWLTLIVAVLSAIIGTLSDAAATVLNL